MEMGPPEHVRNELALPEQLRDVLLNPPVGDELVRTTIVPELTATEDHAVNERLHALWMSVMTAAASVTVARLLLIIWLLQQAPMGSV
jgi:hypothetical protein